MTTKTNSVAAQLAEYGFKPIGKDKWNKSAFDISKIDFSLDGKPLEAYRIMSHTFWHIGNYTINGLLNKLEEMKQDGEI